MEMTDFFQNDFTKSFGQLLALQADIVKQATDANKKVAVEVLKNTKTVLDSFSRNVDAEIKRLEVQNTNPF